MAPGVRNSVDSAKFYQTNNLQECNRKGEMNSFHKENNISTHMDSKYIPGIDWSNYDNSGNTLLKCSLLTAALSFIGLYIHLFLGYLNQLLFKNRASIERNREGYAPLYNKFEQFYSHHIYGRVRHCFNHPICSVPGSEVTLKERRSYDRNWTFSFTGEEKRCVNLGSFNYVGFAESEGPCGIAAADAARKYGLSPCSSRAELGTLPLHQELESLTAEFLGVESAIVFGMGFATNATSLPGLLGPGCLALSDEKNHMSLILGLRLTRATVRVFRHNDMRHLEKLARQAIADGNWKKIFVVVEGVYSMEGSLVPLPAVIAIKQRYNLYLYLDEAHSMGAMGPHARGVTDYYGVNPREVDILMGTFTKSFGAAGGYIAGSRRLIGWVRAHGHAHTYAHAMSPPVAQQIISSMRCIGWGDGARRVANLTRNTRYFRAGLRSMGVVIFGHEDSPVVAMIVYSFSKTIAIVEWLKERGVATVGVGFPATLVNESRIRFCLSSAHTKEHLDRCLNAIREIVDIYGLRYLKPQSIKSQKEASWDVRVSDNPSS